MTTFRVARIYDYQPQEGETAIFLDRLYPRGVHKALMAQVVWLKALTPSAEMSLPPATASMTTSSRTGARMTISTDIVPCSK